MKTLETALALKWRNIPVSGLARVWMKNRPEAALRGRQPYTKYPAIIKAESCVTGGISSPIWFTTVTTEQFLDTEGRDNSLRNNIIQRGEAPAGFYTQDVLRAMDAISGLGKQVFVGNLGWLIVCTAPKTLRQLNTSFPADYAANSARVIAVCRVAIKETQR